MPPTWTAFGSDYFSNHAFDRGTGFVFDREINRWLYTGWVPPKIWGMAWFPHPVPSDWVQDVYYAPGQIGCTVKAPDWTPARREDPTAYRVILHQWFRVDFKNKKCGPQKPAYYIANKRACRYSLHRPLTPQEAQDLPAWLAFQELKAQLLETLRGLGKGSSEPGPTGPTPPPTRWSLGELILGGADVYELDPQDVAAELAWWVLVFANQRVLIADQDAADPPKGHSPVGDLEVGYLVLESLQAPARLLNEAQSQEALRLLGTCGLAPSTRSRARICRGGRFPDEQLDGTA